MENQESNSNAKLTSFSQEEATPNTANSKENNNSNKSESIANKEIVTRPLLWGLVVFLVFFSLVIGAVSVYRMYQDNNAPIVEQNTSNAPSAATDNINNSNNAINSTPVTTDTNKEANVIESEIKNIDTDLETDIYSDQSLGL